MKDMLQRVMDAAKKYSIVDYGALKIALLSAGILIGAYYAPFFMMYSMVLLTVFLISFIWIVYRTFFKHMR